VGIQVHVAVSASSAVGGGGLAASRVIGALQLQNLNPLDLRFIGASVSRGALNDRDQAFLGRVGIVLLDDLKH